MNPLDRRAFLVAALGLAASVLGVVLLPGRALACAAEDLLLGVEHELFVSSRVEAPVVVDVTVVRPPDDAVVLADTVRLAPDGMACYGDPFEDGVVHRIDVSVRDGPSGSGLADGCCLFAGVEPDRVDFHTAFR